VGSVRTWRTARVAARACINACQMETVNVCETLLHSFKGMSPPPLRPRSAEIWWSGQRLGRSDTEGKGYAQQSSGHASLDEHGVRRALMPVDNRLRSHTCVPH